MRTEDDKVDVGWLPKSVVCLRYYNQFRFRSDLRAGLIVAAQILPVSIAIAIASGLPPIYGISCAAIAAFLASGMGESKVRISAPNILFVTVGSSIVSKHGILGLSLSTSLAGMFLIFLAGTGLAAAVPFFPRAIVTGLSSGIAALVVSGLFSDLFGVRSSISVNEVHAGVGAILQHVSPSATIMTTATVALILLCRKVSVLIPASLIAISIGALLMKFDHLSVQTIGSPYGSVLWLFHSLPTGSLRLDLLGGVLGPAFAIAILSAFRSLEAMDVASSLAGERYSPKVELLVQGVANVGCSLVGGLPICGSCVHTSTNVRGGGQTPAAGVLQGVFLVALFVLAAPIVPFIPLPVISAVLVSSVLTMSHWKEVRRLVKLSWSNACAWLATTLLTIITDLLTAIAVGMLIGVFLYIRERRPEPTPSKLHVA
jgi:SulP family sulfate permease